MKPLNSLHFATAAILLLAPAAFAQTDTGTDRVPTGARRAAEWQPSPEGVSSDAWFLSGDVGVALLTGDEAVEDEAGFTAELRIARELASDFYAVGSYLIGFARVEDPSPFSDDEDTAVLHIPTLGIGWRPELTPEIHLLLEPRIGVIFGDADTAPAGGGSIGVEIQLDPGIHFNARFTALFTGTDVDTPGEDADLNALWSAAVGMTWEF